MAAQRRGWAGAVAAERPLGRSASELLLHPELLSEEFLLLTLEQVGRPRRGGAALPGAGGGRPASGPSGAVWEVLSQPLSGLAGRAHQKHSGKK